MRTDFQAVVDGWRHADPDLIHPSRGRNMDDYWSSGASQAIDAAAYAPDGGRVLDFGCGDGRLAIPLALLGFDVVAVDSSPEMLERLAANALDQDVEVATVLSDGTGLAELIGRTVDVVVCRAVLIHHSYTDGARLVTSLAGVLDTGGHLVADWPVGRPHERRDWIDVTVWDTKRRAAVASRAGLTLVSDDGPSVWVRRRVTEGMARIDAEVGRE